MSEWMDIESAPKDGTRIDLWCINTMGEEHYGKGYRFTDCTWLSDLTQVPRWIARCGEETVEDCGWRVTHWMPLPPPPGDGER